MKVLAIGNSFSQDAMRYLHRLAKANGDKMKTVNLYIGGCPLSAHYINMNNDSAVYDFEFNGEGTGIKVSIRQALQSDCWDVVTLQQASHESTFHDKYTPYIERLAEYVRYHAPKAKIMIHQTWAYEQGSERLTGLMDYSDQADMYSDIKNAYNRAAESINADGIIPSGQTLQNLLSAGIEKVHRDTFHASLGLGRYALALTWYEMLTGKTDNSFNDFDEPVSEAEKEIAREAVHKAISEYKK